MEVRDEPIADAVGEAEEADTSIARDEEVVPHIVEDRAVDVGFPRNMVLRMALSLLDDVDTSVVFRQRAAVMRTVPHFLRSSCKNAMKIGFGRSYLGESPHGRGSTGKRMETLHVAAQDVAAQTSRWWIDLERENWLVGSKCSPGESGSPC